MRLHEVLLSWDLDDWMTLGKHSSRSVDLTMLRWAARVEQLVPLAVRHRANSPDFFKVQRGTKWVAWGEVQIYIYICSIYRFVFSCVFFVDVPSAHAIYRAVCGLLGVGGSRNAPMLSLLFAVMCRTSDKRSHKIDRLVCPSCRARRKRTRILVAGCCRDKGFGRLDLGYADLIRFRWCIQRYEGKSSINGMKAR